MPDYAPVANQVKVPDAMQSLGSVMNFASGAQQLQRGGVALQQESQDLAERNALNGLLKDHKKYTLGDGSPDYDRLNAEALKVAPKLGPKFMEAIAQAHQKSVDVQRNLLALGGEKRKAIGEILQAGQDLPLNDLHKLIDLNVKANPTLAAWGDLAKQHLANAKPEELPEAVQRLAKSTMTVPEQIKAATPEGPIIGSGQVSQMFNVKQSAGPVGPVPGTAVQQQLPPDTRTVGPNGQPQYLGPQGGQTARVPAANPPGMEQSIQGSVESMNNDWAATTSAASHASANTANLQNIKRFAETAVTGVGSDRRQFIAGLADYLGMDAGTMTKTSTDLLAKNANMLALAGGNTDLARTLAEVANPNQHMTKEAIKEAADQLIGVHSMNLAKQKFLLPFKNLNDPTAYHKALAEWNANSDFRVFQWENMSKEQKHDMAKNMSESEWNKFKAKAAKLKQLGVVE